MLICMSDDQVNTCVCICKAETMEINIKLIHIAQ